MSRSQILIILKLSKMAFLPIVSAANDESAGLVELDVVDWSHYAFIHLSVAEYGLHSFVAGQLVIPQFFFDGLKLVLLSN